MALGHEQDQVEQVYNQEQKLRKLTAQYLNGQIPLEEYQALVDKEGPHINLIAMGAYLQKQEFKR